jgi:hypothetical protein
MSVVLLGDEDEEVVPEDVKLTYHAQAEVGVRIPHFQTNCRPIYLDQG